MITKGVPSQRPTSYRLSMQIRVAGWGEVTLQQLEAMFVAYMNAGAPKPILEGTREEQRAALEEVRARGDSQMQALMNRYLDSDESAKP